LTGTWNRDSPVVSSHRGSEVLSFLEDKVAKWWLPDDVVFLEEIPKTSVGKFSKKELRTQFDDYELPNAR